MHVPEGESFADFKNSFSYGDRNNLSFKFLKQLSEADAAEFLRVLLSELAQTVNDGDADRLIQAAYEWQVAAYKPAADAKRTWVYDDGPFAAMTKPVTEARVALLTSSGHFVAGDDPSPFGVDDMRQEEAMARISEFMRETPMLSEIPVDTPRGQVRVRHGGYDISAALADPEVTLPRAALRSMEAEGRIGALAPTAFSFTGATSQRRLLKHAAPHWADRLKEDHVDAVLLVPV